MKQVSLIGNYVHVSFGNYEENLFPMHPEDTLASFTGIVTDGDLETGTFLLGAVIANWGFALGFSTQGRLTLPPTEDFE